MLRFITKFFGGFLSLTCEFSNTCNFNVILNFDFPNLDKIKIVSRRQFSQFLPPENKSRYSFFSMSVTKCLQIIFSIYNL